MSKQQTPIAVVGVSAVFPGSVDATGFWNDILAGRDLLTDVPESHWLIDDYYDPDPSVPDKTYANRGAFIPAVPFDPMEFGVPPTIVPATDTTQLLALIVAKRVLQDACRERFDEIDREKVSVILGVTSAQELLGSMVSRLQKPMWVAGLRRAGLPEDEVQRACELISENYVDWQESTFPGVLGNVVAGRIANRLDLHGTNCVTDAACASSFSALSMAVNELQLHQSDLVLTGGCDTMNDIFMYMCFSKTPALSKSGDCRPFSDQADGTMLGEGLGMVALKRLEDAERDGDKIYAVLRGVGTSSDGRAKSVYAPVPEGQARAVRRAYEQAGYDASTVSLVEGHGTGTIAGDAAEFAGIDTAFRESGREDNQWCAMGSVKSQIGHTKAAAGAAGLFKVVMALHHKVIPPTIKVNKPNPKMNLENSPFYLPNRVRPWIRGEHPRRAAVSSFGFGGSNFHLTLEEYEGDNPAERFRIADSELVLITGDTPAAVARQARAWAAESTEAPFLQWAARTSQLNLGDAPSRLAVVATDEADLAAKLVQAAAQIENDPSAFSTPNGIDFAPTPDLGDVAYVFSGQGSQYVDMGLGLLANISVARAVWDNAPAFDESLADVVFPKPTYDAERDKAQAAKLTATEWAQPGIGAVSASQLAVLRQIGLEPSCVAGHSYGEVTALYAAGVLSAADLFRVARKRGELMAEAAKTEGSMTAVSADIEQVKALLEKSGADVVVANHNHPTQVVLSGTTEGIEAVEAFLKDQGVSAKRLSVATAFHSSVVSDSVEPFAEFLEDIDFDKAAIPVYANTTAKTYPKKKKAARKLLANQIANPVHWVDQIEAMYEAGVRTFVEVGPNRVLTGLVGRILGDRPHRAIALDRKGKDALESFHRGLGQLVVAGANPDLAPLWADYREPIHPKDKPKARLELGLSGTNYGKPYPPAEGAAGRPKPNPPRQPEVVVKEVIKEVPVEVEKVVEVPVYVDSPQSGAAPTQRLTSSAPDTSAATQAQPGWMAAYADAQRQTAEAHAAYQNAMAESHVAFLNAIESSMNTLATMGQGTARPTAAVHRSAPVRQPAPVAAAPTPPPAPTSSTPLGPARSTRAGDASLSAGTPVASNQDAAHSPHGQHAGLDAAQPALDLNGLMLDIVSEKTGYPADMLGLEMHLESDLGIDSIKRVEILSTMRERAPELPEVDGAEMAQLQTLGQIVDYMQSKLPAPSTPLGAARSTRAGDASLAGSAGTPVASNLDAAHSLRGQQAGLDGAQSTLDVNALMLDIVAEKTGYPADMLGLEMHLESDLGIDSIKRVEILSTMRERAPELPEVDGAEMAQLQTLGQIVDYMQSKLPAPSTPLGAARSTRAGDASLAGSAGTPVASNLDAAHSLRGQQAGLDGAQSTLDVNALMMDIVAEKTGYPADMLGLEMHLESDLGIDSIKRVEILSTMRERAPELPEVDGAEMAQLQTLGQIVDYMQSKLPAPSTPLGAARSTRAGDASLASSAGTPVASNLDAAHSLRGQQAGLDGAPGLDVNALMMDIVAEKTGYPADMLGLEMHLESDLGIDSIKRVEILSTMRERAPELPEVDGAEMAQLQTLGQIVDYMNAKLGGGATTAPTPRPVTSVGVPHALGRYVLDEVDAPPVGLSLPGLHGNIVITPSPVSEALATQLGRVGLSATVGAPTEDTDALIYMGGLADSGVIGDIEGALDCHRDAFAAANTVAPNFSNNGGLFVTVQDTGGDFGLTGSDRAWLGGLPGLVKTAAQEWPEASLKAIDIERGDRNVDLIAAAIASELLSGGPELEVGLHADGRRTTLKSVKQDVPTSGETRFGKDDIIVASGGARGVTAATLIALARDTQASFVLLGRTPLEDEPADIAGIADEVGLKKVLLASARSRGETPKPVELGRQVKRILAGREVKSTLAAMEAAGSRARYVSADVTDTAAVASALDTVRKDWGPITGLVHGAGVLADKLIADKTQDQFDFVFDVKVKGLLSLQAATADDPLRLVVFFSSVAGRCGNQGQCDYAMANELLNKVGGKLQSDHPELVVKSLGWGPWEGGMVTPALKARFESLGVPLIPLDVGAKMLVDEVQRGELRRVELVLGGEPKSEALAAESDGNPSLTLAVRVHRELQPYLVDHSIQGEPVVPVVLAMEWFARTARAMRPDLRLKSLQDVKVLKGIRLPSFDTDGDLFFVDLEQLSNGSGAVFSMLLRGADGTRHYAATAQMATRLDSPDKARPLGKLTPWSGAVYGGVLFHGADFQAIDEMIGVNEDGISARVTGTASKDWDGPWLTDPLALDAGLQLALLFTEHSLKGASLPTGIKQYRGFTEHLTEGPLQVVLTGKTQGKSKVSADLVFLNADGEAVAELQGVETHVLPQA